MSILEATSFEGIENHIRDLFELIRTYNKELAGLLREKDSTEDPAEIFLINCQIQLQQECIRSLAEEIQVWRRRIREREKQLRNNIELRNEGGARPEARTGGGALQQHAVSGQGY